jgi:hypothetical protein
MPFIAAVKSKSTVQRGWEFIFSPARLFSVANVRPLSRERRFTTLQF